MDATQRMPAIVSFVQTVDRGSFAAAARFLGISAAAVSKNVASLESALGVRLLNRTTRSLHLTTEGEAFVERARIAIDALDAAVDAVAEQRAEATGRVRISCANSFGQTYLMPLLPGLHARHPGLQLEIDLDDRQVDLIAGGYDIGVRGGPATDSNLVSRPIATLETVLVAAPDYLARRGTPTSVADLAAHDLINIRFLSGQSSPWTFRQKDGGVRELRPENPVLTVSSPFAAMEAARLGMGIAQIGLPHGWHLLRAGALEAVLLQEHHPGSRRLALQYPHRALIAPRVRVSVDYLATHLAANEALQASCAALSSLHRLGGGRRRGPSST
jgi:DNA-binding transcriptional LysR family regulator